MLQPPHSARIQVRVVATPGPLFELRAAIDNWYILFNKQKIHFRSLFLIIFYFAVRRPVFKLDKIGENTTRIFLLRSRKGGRMATAK